MTDERVAEALAQLQQSGDLPQAGSEVGPDCPLPEFEAFPLLSEAVSELSEQIGVSHSLSLVALLGSANAVVSRQFTVATGYGEMPTSLLLIAAAPVAAGKGLAFKRAFKPMRSAAHRRRKAYESDHADWERARDAAKEAKAEFDEREPLAPLLDSSNVTAEGVYKHVRRSDGAALALVNPEAKTLFGNWTAQASQRGAFLGFLTQSWSGEIDAGLRALDNDVRTLKRFALSVCLAAQPQPVLEYLTHPHARDGLMARALVAFQDRPLVLRPNKDYQTPHLGLWLQSVGYLWDRSEPTEEDDLPIIQLDADVEAWREDRQFAMLTQAVDEDDEGVASWLTRSTENAVRIAANLSAVEAASQFSRGDIAAPVVEMHHWEAALVLIEWFAGEARRVLASGDETEVLASARDAVSVLGSSSEVERDQDTGYCYLALSRLLKTNSGMRRDERIQEAVLDYLRRLQLIEVVRQNRGSRVYIAPAIRAEV